MARGEPPRDDDECSDVSTHDPFFVTAPEGDRILPLFIPPGGRLDALESRGDSGPGAVQLPARVACPMMSGFPPRGYNGGMDQPLEPPFSDHPDFPSVLSRLREELELGNRHGVGMAFVIIEIDDTVPEREGEIIRERLMHRAVTAAQRSTRQERSLTRKVADFIVRLDQYMFISLGAVSSGSLRIPLGRVVNQMRNELYATPDIHSMRLRRRLSMGVAHWLPEVGFITEQMMFAKAWQAFAQAKESGGLADPAGFLGLAPSNLDLMQIQVYDWGTAQIGPKARQTELSSKRPAVVSKTGPSRPERKIWEFWK